MDLENLFKDLVWDALVKSALKLLFQAVPWLAWGPLGVVVTWLVTMFADKLYAVVKLSIELEKIVITNELHRKAFEGASVKLKILAHDKGVDSEEFKNARQVEKLALSQFVQFTL